jgi:hypothetical protein
MADDARAQVNEFAEVCTGLSVTLPVIQPIVGGLLGPIVGLINTGIVDVLSGQTLGVKILDEDGDILADGACKVEADGYAVDNAQGITIGGGQINGLGGTGNALASAGHASAIAFGNGALTATGVQQAMAIGTTAQVFTGATGAIALGSSADVLANATGAIALGADSETSVAGSVALGQGSVGAATSLTNGTVTTNTGPVDLTYSNNTNTNAGSVSVGTTALRRQLKNVADGSDAHDAATVGQLAGVVVDTNTALNAAETSIDTIGSGLATSLGGGAAYNTGTNAFTAPSYVLTSGTFANVGAALGNIDTRTATNTTAIATAETAFDNLGSGLATSFGGTAAYNTGTNVFTTPTFTLSTGPFASVNGALLDIDGRVVTNTANIATNTTNIATNATNIANVETSKDNLGTSLATSLGGGAAYNTGTNAFTAPSFALSSGTYTNVNGALVDIDGRVVTNTVNIATNTSNIATNTADIATNATNIGNVETSKDNLGTSLAASLGGGAAYNSGTNAFTSPSFVLSTGTFNNVNGALLNLDGRVAINTTDITNLDGDLTTLINQIQDGEIGLVQQDGTTRDITVGADTDGTLVSFFNNNGDPRVLDGVAVGALSALSTDAVNGSQLFAANSAVDAAFAALGGGATYDPLTSAFTSPSFVLSSGTFNTVGSALLDLDGRVATNTTDISTIETDITNLINEIDGGGIGLVQQEVISRNITVGADTDGTLVSFFNDNGDPRVLDGVAAGTLSALSTDAINGSQLFATNTALDGAVAALGGGAVYDPLTSVFTGPSYVLSSGAFNTVGTALLDLDGRVVTNTTNIATNTANIATNTTNIATNTTNIATNTTNIATNATNIANVESSKDALGASVAASLGGGAAYDSGTNVFTGPSFVLSSGAFNSVNGALLNLDGRVAANTTDISNLTTLLNGGEIGLVQQDSTTRDISVGADTDGTLVSFFNDNGDPRLLDGVAAGALSALSLEAVNGSQLFATNTALDGTVAALGGGAAYDPLTSVFTGPSYVLSSGAFNNVGAALLNLDGRVVTNTSDITTIEGDIVTIEGDITNLTNLINGAGIGLVAQDSLSRDINIGAATDGTVVNFENDTGTARTLTGVAEGTLSASSTEAVNGSQLFSTNSAVEDAYSALGGGASFNPTTGVATGPSYSVQGGTHTNVGSALTALDGQVTTNTTDIANLQTNINNGSVGLVRQDAGTRVISVGGTTDGTSIDLRNNAAQARTVSGVANGQISGTSSEAVNGSQIAAVGQSIASALGGGTGVLPNGTLSAPTYAIEGNTYNNVGAALAAVDSSIGDIRTQITNISSSGSPYIAIHTARPAAVAGSAESLAIGGGAQANGLNSTAVGHDAVANGAGASAFGMGATAGGANSVALGAGANAAHNNSVALGAGAATTRDNQIAMGSIAHTYTMAGITSAQSRAAQSGAVQVVTSDAGGNLATANATDLFPQIGSFDGRIDSLERGMSVHSDGIAMALALGGAMAPPDGKTFAISGNLGLFEGAQAMGFSAVGRLDDSWFVNASVGMGFATSTVGGRLGATYAW